MIIGLTGGIGAGKSVVAKVLESMGYAVFYSDKEAKDLVNQDPEIRRKLNTLVGEDLFESGELNRKRLAELIFQSPELRSKVNSIIHPRVRQQFSDFCGVKGLENLIFNEAAILFETGAYKNFDKNILVVAPEELRIQRVIRRDNIKEDEVRERLSAQWSDEQKGELADYIIVNDEKQPLLRQIENVIDQLISS